MGILFIMLVFDYVLTFIGIQRGIIEEANPMMKWLFDTSFIKGIMIRIAMSVLILVPFYFLKRLDAKTYKILIEIICILYSIVFLLHLRWILPGGGR